ncbi:hypothetical protein DSC45_08440 [Streptomyces sp. YIM 130001]|uniref:SCO7613 C-terminal domain-containing membrane protein n=1 Tax=Streptomyces sp. YIM 130001 TaxID=2259644 RepID=UPI000E653665|nr:hypothetical protein [Streptomyces sp. YIM 130001]RII18639.1 hypothetical protein DSC45_08440 [Streptomyces sp. YIM 130001]
MHPVPPPAEELRILDHELGRLESRRGQLLARRAVLVSALAQEPPRPSVPPAAPWGSAWGSARPTAETNPPGVRNVLLALGGVLLAVAAVAFTLFSWGHLGIGGRAAVLGAATAAALAAPVLLLRRGLGATAETVAATALVLTLLDAYAVHRVALADVAPLRYATVASGVLALLWAAYGAAARDLRSPLPVALMLGQFPLLLGCLAADVTPLTFAVALLATAAADCAPAWRPVSRAVRVTASAAACVMGTAAVAMAVALSAAARTPSAAAGPGMLLLAAAALALLAASRLTSSRPAIALSVVAGGALVLAPASVASTSLPGTWTVPLHLLCSVGVLTLWLTRLPLALRHGLALACGAVQAWALLWSLPSLSGALSAPAAQLNAVWSGAANDVAYGTGVGPAAPACLAVLAAVLLLARRQMGPAPTQLAATAHQSAEGSTTTINSLTNPASSAILRQTAAICGALFLAWSAVTAATAAFDLPHPAALAVHIALALALLMVAALLPRARASSGTEKDTQRTPLTALTTTATVLAGASAVSAFLLGLATRPATVTTLGILLAGCLAASVVHPEGRGRWAPACGAVACATALAVAVPASLGLPRHAIAPVLLLIPAATAAVGHRLRGLGVAAPVESAGAGAGLLALAAAADRAPHLALTLALGGLIAAATALRPERRRVAAPLAATLFVLAGWVRLAAWDVGTPEAYTLPVTIPALVLGLLHRRRSPELPSWTAYGPGLATTLVPSLIAVWGEATWQRPLLLGTAALAVTLLGARHGLQAPLALGSATAGLVGLHELAPHLAQLVGTLPRWLPPALAGLLLLALGATYEHRLRDARRLRELLGRMH